MPSQPSWILFLTILAAVFCVSAQTNTPDLNEIAGDYITSNGFTGYRITLKANGTYLNQYFADCCRTWKPEQGTFSVSANAIRFITTKKKVSEKHFVRWGDRMYLIDDYKSFAAAINSGVEPRATIISEDALTDGVYIRRGHEKLPVSGLPITSADVIYLFSAPLIQVRITKTEQRGPDFFAEVDKGSADGLGIGMCFFERKPRLDYDPVMCVVSMREHAATLNREYSSGWPRFTSGQELLNKLQK